MATVRPHGNKVEARFSINGSRVCTTIDYTPTKTGIQAAERKCAEADRRLNAGEPWESVRSWLRGERKTPHQSLGRWSQHYLDVIAPEIDGVADSTLMGYESLYNSHWLPFDGRDIHSLTLDELQRHLMTKPLVKKTKREALSLLRRIFKLAGITTLENWEIKRSKKDAAPDPDPYTSAERDQLIKALEPWPIAWRYFLTGFYTGMRTGELLGLHWTDYDGTGFNVWQSMVRRKLQTHTKTKRRYVVLPGLVIDVMKNNPTRFTKGLVFQTPEGHMFRDADWLMEKWSAAHEKAGVRKRTGLYPWRHTYISLALGGGMNINDVAVHAGNSRSIIEKHYAKWIPHAGDLARIRSQIEAAQR